LLALPGHDTQEGYDYPARVRWASPGELASYEGSGEFLNFNNIDMVCPGSTVWIFGGPAGSHILIYCDA